MKLFFHPLLFASVAAFSLPQIVQAVEINHFVYCSVTVNADGEHLTILVPKINLPKISKQLDIVGVDCSDNPPPNLFLTQVFMAIATIYIIIFHCCIFIINLL
jgi:hypothetical protein